MQYKHISATIFTRHENKLLKQELRAMDRGTPPPTQRDYCRNITRDDKEKGEIGKIASDQSIIIKIKTNENVDDTVQINH